MKRLHNRSLLRALSRQPCLWCAPLHGALLVCLAAPCGELLTCLHKALAHALAAPDSVGQPPVNGQARGVQVVLVLLLQQAPVRPVCHVLLGLRCEAGHQLHACRVRA